ncbi:MAG: murein transglycosylase [Desulfobacteraceae bacterium 4572_130]|nr:MAG: murein transglycosylase [Desulfobacteraceae bacterium 4572_130]
MKKPILKKIIILLLFFLPLFFTGCGIFLKPEKPQKPEPSAIKSKALKKLPLAQYPDFIDQSDNQSLVNAIKQSLIYYNRIPEKMIFYFGKDFFCAKHIKKSIEIFLSFIEKNPTQKQLNQFIRNNYLVYKARGRKKDFKVFFTGYYEPFLLGSLIKNSEYIYPIYSKPWDLVSVDLSPFSSNYKKEPPFMARVDNKKRLIPYYSRKEINSIKNFYKKAKPIVWVNNRIDRFFLEIQGSGIVKLKQGGFLRVHYHTSNGHPYKSIGRYLINKNQITKKKMSMQAIRKWLKNNPLKIDEVLNYNPSFVFFKREKHGPFGCLGVKVTPKRSIATDKSIFPKGTLGFIKTFMPLKSEMEAPEKWKKYSGFVLNQDTGGAIKGTGRADLFYGNGKYAEFAAGHMKHTGDLYFLVLKKAQL